MYADEFITKNVLNNYKFYAKQLRNSSTIATRLTDQQRQTLENATQSLNITESGEFVSSTPSLCMRGNYLVVNVRYVNYRIDDTGNYINQEKIHTRNAVAIIDVSKTTWKIIQEFELEYDHTLNSHYVGLEDVRLFQWNSKILYNSNRGIGFNLMKIEHGEVDFAKERTINNKCLTKQNECQIEKNWVMFSDASNTMKTIYNWSPKLIIGDIHNNQFIETHQINVPYCFKYLRGSTNGIVIQNEIWFICHSVSYEERRYYYHMVIVLDLHTYNVKRYTPFFTFEGEKVEYTLGFVYSEQNTDFLIGYSVYDNTTKYVNIPREYFENSMIHVA
jgi:hypothetical protein